jgi:NNP family nitrate/nitrite transporter-like MFS transporter
LHFDASFMVWVLLGVLGNYIAEDFGLTASQKGLMIAVPILSASFLRVLVGFLSDRFGARRTGTISMALVLAPLLWGWLAASNFYHVLALGVLLGIAGSSFAVALPLASRWYPPEKQGIVMGIAGAGNSGTVIASLLAPRLAESVGWHGVFGLLAIPVAVVALTFALLARESPNQPPPQNATAYFRLLREPDAWWFCLLYSITFGGFVGLSSFLGIFFRDQYGLDKVMAGNLTAMCVFAGSLLRPFGGYVADRAGGIHMLALVFPAVALWIFGVSQLPALPAAVAFLVLGMGCLGMGNGAVFQLVPQRFGREIGVATGLVGAAGGLGGFLLPSLLGSLKDYTGSYAWGFVLFSGASVAACLLVLALYRGWRLTWLRSQKVIRIVVGVENDSQESFVKE